MNSRIKNITVTVLFLLTLFGVMLITLFMPDAEYSFSERRRLEQPPAFSIKKLFSGELFEDFDEYTLDQFPLRDIFRAVKAYIRYYPLAQKDNNGIYVVGGNINKILYPLNEDSVRNAAGKFNAIYNRYLPGMNVYYSVIPDKNYFVAAENGYPSIDYEKMIGILCGGVRNIEYIDIIGSLSLDDYYYTDIHWNQEKITGVADILLAGMGCAARVSDTQYTRTELYPFRGAYLGQSALFIEPDTLVFLTNSITENAVVYDCFYKTYSKVYMPEKFGGIDPYDVFLSGALPLISIENKENGTGRELLLFRDSFGSSIAPLLLEGYSKITLIDLRYISADILGKYIEFKDQDVLFLYNTQVINNSYMLK
jgi:hypothetical protein